MAPHTTNLHVSMVRAMQKGNSNSTRHFPSVISVSPSPCCCSCCCCSCCSCCSCCCSSSMGALLAAAAAAAAACAFLSLSAALSSRSALLVSTRSCRSMRSRSALLLRFALMYIHTYIQTYTGYNVTHAHGASVRYFYPPSPLLSRVWSAQHSKAVGCLRVRALWTYGIVHQARLVAYTCSTRVDCIADIAHVMSSLSESHDMSARRPTQKKRMSVPYRDAIAASLCFSLAPLPCPASSCIPATSASIHDLGNTS